ncbi:MAG: fibronectin type III-like domain-contianing protein, partial [Muribaculaceae bacterium]|nr:fibronectin type III-like domain-contianing protein [Muribaculaceae bacterium]
YVTDHQSTQPLPRHELNVFEKVKLQPGKSQRVNVVLDKEAFSFYNPDLQDFVVEPGSFTISVGNSSDNLPLSGMIDL